MDWLVGVVFGLLISLIIDGIEDVVTLAIMTKRDKHKP